MPLSRRAAPTPSVYLNKHEFADYIRLKNSNLPGAQVEFTQSMKQVARKLENVDERLIWTDTDGALAHEQTWRADSIRQLPNHIARLAVAEGQQNDVLAKTRVRTRLGDVISAERPMDYAIEMPFGYTVGAPPLAAISIYSGASELLKPDNSTYMPSSAKKVQPTPPPYEYPVPRVSRPSSV